MRSATLRDWVLASLQDSAVSVERSAEAGQPRRKGVGGLLTRIRIEVSDEASTAAVTNELDRYERAVMASEAMRHGRKLPQSAHEVLDRTCELRPDPDLADFLGREVTDEVIEYDASLPGHKGRRVVRFKRLDTRGEAEAPPKPDGDFGGEPGSQEISKTWTLLPDNRAVRASTS